LDVDPRNGGTVEMLPEGWQDTLHARTGGGGVHAVYRVPTGRKGKSPGRGVDAKSGPGAYICVEPSLHKSGKRYEWADWDVLESDGLPDILELPETLLAPTAPTEPTALLPADYPEDWDPLEALRSLSEGRRALIEKGAPEGKRSEAFHGLVCGLHEEGWLPAQIILILKANPAGIAAKYAGRIAEAVGMSCSKSRGFGVSRALAVQSAPVAQQADGGVAYEKVTTGRYKGRFVANAAQVLACMSRDTRFPWQVSFDSFLQDRLVTRRGVRSTLDNEAMPMRAWFDENEWEPVPNELVRGAAHTVALAHTSNLAADYVRGLVGAWDGKDRTQGLLDALGVATSAYTVGVVHYLLTAMAQRAISPGCQADNIVVLKGPQGAGKSQALRALAPVIGGLDTYREGNLADLLTEERSARLCRGCLILNLDELRQIGKREAAEVKTALSRTHETYVQKYREDRVTFGRSCVLVGTTNQDEFLEDATGNRRYFVLETGESIDRDWIRANCEQLWAQGATWAAHGGIRWRDATSLAREVVAQYEVEDAREAAIEEYSRKHNNEPLLMADVLLHALGVPLERQTRQLHLLAGAALKREGRRKSKGYRHKVDGREVKAAWWLPDSGW
jgi:hypothetical protein